MLPDPQPDPVGALGLQKGEGGGPEVLGDPLAMPGFRGLKALAFSRPGSRHAGGRLAQAGLGIPDELAPGFANQGPQRRGLALPGLVAPGGRWDFHHRTLKNT